MPVSRPKEKKSLRPAAPNATTKTRPKKLPDGSTLLARLAKSKNPQARLATRIKNEQELRDVFAYLEPLIARSAAGPETGR